MWLCGNVCMYSSCVGTRLSIEATVLSRSSFLWHKDGQTCEFMWQRLYRLQQIWPKKVTCIIHDHYCTSWGRRHHGDWQYHSPCFSRDCHDSDCVSVVVSASMLSAIARITIITFPIAIATNTAILCSIGRLCLWFNPSIIGLLGVWCGGFGCPVTCHECVVWVVSLFGLCIADFLLFVFVSSCIDCRFFFL